MSKHILFLLKPGFFDVEAVDSLYKEGQKTAKAALGNWLANKK